MDLFKLITKEKAIWGGGFRKLNKENINVSPEKFRKVTSEVIGKRR